MSKTTKTYQAAIDFINSASLGDSAGQSCINLYREDSEYRKYINKMTAGSGRLTVNYHGSVIRPVLIEDGVWQIEIDGEIISKGMEEYGFNDSSPVWFQNFEDAIDIGKIIVRCGAEVLNVYN
jgi:hypothetical protein